MMGSFVPFVARLPGFVCASGGSGVVGSVGFPPFGFWGCCGFRGSRLGCSFLAVVCCEWFTAPQRSCAVYLGAVHGQSDDDWLLVRCVFCKPPPLMLVSFPSSSSAQEVGGRWVLPDTDSLGLFGATGSISNMICHPSLLSGWTVSKGTPLAIYGQHRSSTPSCSQRNLAAVLSVIRGCRRVEIEIRFSRLVKLPAGIQDSSCTGTDVRMGLFPFVT